MGVVTALDVTHDRASGCDAGKIAEAIRVSRDRRVKYIIWNRRIASSSAVGAAAAWAWRPYTGANPHDKHVHISVKATKALYDSNQPWEIDAVSVISDPVGPDVSSRPLLRRGSRAAAVGELQTLLNRHGSGLAVDGKFGEVTETAVKVFQRMAGLVDDGAVGAKTWAALLA
jgi:murein L,D-transpeptidase YcbB/YkuD